jgi:hypothetical protein
MKFGKIVALCKKNKRVRIYDLPGIDIQWIGTLGAMYAARGIPTLDEESMLALCDVPDKDIEKWSAYREEFPKGYCIENKAVGSDDDDSTSMAGLSIYVDGVSMIPLYIKDSVIFIDESLVAPVAGDYTTLHIRHTADGQPYVIAKIGFIVAAVILPYGYVSDELALQVHKLSDACSVAAKEAKKLRALASSAAPDAGAAEPEQCAMSVDPDTGEMADAPVKEKKKSGRKDTAK